MRIAFFVEGMEASGVDTSTHLLADALRAAGHEVVFFHPWKEKDEADDENSVLVPGVRVSSAQPVYLSLPVSWNMFERFRREPFDLIHVHTSTTINLLAWQMSALADLPLVYTYHTMTPEYAHYLGPLAESFSGVVNPAIEFFDRTICNAADVVVAPSPKAQRYLEAIGIKPPVRHIPNGIDLGRFRAQPSSLLRDRLGIAPERPILLWVGRLNEEKRPLLALRLFARLHGQEPGAVLVLVGEGALRPELEAEIESSGLADSVFLYGLADYDEMPALYAAADVWVSTSVSEVHPMVALEAAACGLPALAWDDPALEGVVQNGQSGLLAADDEAFVAAGLRLLGDAELRRAYGLAAQQVAAGYAVEATAERMIELYAGLLGHHAAPRDLSSLAGFFGERRLREQTPAPPAP